MSLKSSQPVEIQISRALVVDKLSELLYSLNLVPDNYDVRDILFENTSDKLWTMKALIRKEKEVLVSKHHGFKTKA